jgi:hypothetical protein
LAFAAPGADVDGEPDIDHDDAAIDVDGDDAAIDVHGDDTAMDVDAAGGRDA